jgi:Ca-activated chloride channel family protein
LADQAGIFVGGATVDDEDVERVQRRIQSHLRVVQQDDPTARWKDFGYYLVYPIALLALFWFRRGWTVRWGAALIVLSTVGCVAEPGSRTGFANLSALGFSELTRFADLWLTPDQQGRYLFERARYQEAGDRFADFMWQGTARYRAGDMDGAVLAFARVDSPEAHFALGNTYARIGSDQASIENGETSIASITNYEASIASYDRALTLRPDWTEAQENRELVQSLLPPPPDDEEEDEQGGDTAPPPSFDPDAIEISEDEIRGERGEVDGSLLDEDQLTEMWMRRLQTSPGEFLRRRFAIERAEREAAGPGGGG